MRTIMIKKIRFGSFMKLTFLVGISLGLLTGLLVFFGVLNGRIYVSFNGTQVEGVYGAIVGMLELALSLPLGSSCFGLFAYLPFMLLLKITKGIKITILSEEDETIIQE